MELVLNTFGVSLNRDNEGFVITSANGRQRVQKGKLIIKTNAKGDLFGFVRNCYVAGYLIKDLKNGHFVRVVAMKDGQKQHALRVLTQEASS